MRKKSFHVDALNFWRDKAKTVQLKVRLNSKFKSKGWAIETDGIYEFSLFPLWQLD